ncbi:unnamed protein product [Angiostrongylus costaricensis]|uniref:MARVEL domain-containing protein n=1 Tax=Angiostrongylus costaricensis TaxID=334426 RepID=A0A0R3PTI0_ANGCS|nr:unnamed protein product [Angiostrongylus costaricensis]
MSSGFMIASVLTFYEHSVMTLASRSRFIFLIISSLLALISTAIIASCLFSVSFRYITDHENLKGTRYYGLIRYCFESEYQTFGTGECRFSSAEDRFFAEFELATLILLSSAIASSLLSICFAIFTIFTVFGALAHCVMLLTATICSISAFVVYTYFNELKDNQNETYHFGWAYYWSGGSSAGLFVAFICSLFASACVLLHKQQKNRIDSIVL